MSSSDASLSEWTCFKINLHIVVIDRRLFLHRTAIFCVAFDAEAYTISSMVELKSSKATCFSIPNESEVTKHLVIVWVFGNHGNE